MGKDNQPKHRQKARDLSRRSATRQPRKRLLIVCEGEKTEPQYLEEIRREKRLSTAHVLVQQGGLGTAPLQVAQFAKQLFENGDVARRIERRAFDHVFVVFDRDRHESYEQALDALERMNMRLRNDAGQPVPVDAVVSVPCFELWLLLHFQDVRASLDCSEACRRVKQHVANYEKGRGGYWAQTKDRLATALERAQQLEGQGRARDDSQPYTAVGTLVNHLLEV
jgi:hypothetical protein